jgi:choline dehydrogenase
LTTSQKWRDAIQWPTNYASDRNWSFLGQPSPYLNGRRMPLAMGKVLGGGSSINAMAWARGHKNDWDFFASEVGIPTLSSRNGWIMETGGGPSILDMRVRGVRGASDQ